MFKKECILHFIFFSPLEENDANFVMKCIIDNPILMQYLKNNIYQHR